MGMFGNSLKPLLSAQLLQSQQQPMMSRELMQQDRMPSMGYDRNAAMQGQSGFAPMNQMQPQKKPGFFSKGGAFVNILGAFGDAFSGNGPVYAQQKAQRNRLMQEQQMAEQKRQQDRENFLFEESYKRANPMPANNDTINDFNWYSKLTPEQRTLYHQMKPTIAFRADGTPIAVNPMQLGQPQQSGPKPGTIEGGYEFIGGNPADPKSWRQVGGGGVGNGTSGF